MTGPRQATCLIQDTMGHLAFEIRFSTPAVVDASQASSALLKPPSWFTLPLVLLLKRTHSKSQPQSVEAFSQ